MGHFRFWKISLRIISGKFYSVLRQIIIIHQCQYIKFKDTRQFATQPSWSRRHSLHRVDGYGYTKLTTVLSRTTILNGTLHYD